MLQLAAQKREQYAAAQPVFHRRAANDVAAQEPYFRDLIRRPGVIALVATDRLVVGFAIAEIHVAPAVYDPGGPAALIDDFCVATPDLWPTVGQQLLRSMKYELHQRRVAVVIAVCGHHDAAKRSLLMKEGLDLASEWCVQGLE